MPRYHAALYWLLVSSLSSVDAFAPPSLRNVDPPSSSSSAFRKVTTASPASTQLSFFWNRDEEKDADKKKDGDSDSSFMDRLKAPFQDNSSSNDDGKANDDVIKKEETVVTTVAATTTTAAPAADTTASTESNTEKLSVNVSAATNASTDTPSTTAAADSSVTPAGPTVVVAAKIEKPAVPTPPPPPPPLSVDEQAKKFRSDAEKIRLEAERMDAELTLMKIAKLEKKLAEAKKKTGSTAEETLATLERDMDILQRRLRGEPITVPPPAPKIEAIKAAMGEKPKPAVAVEDPIKSYVADELKLPLAPRPVSKNNKGLTQQQIRELSSGIENAPKFMKTVLARITKTDYNTIDGLNTTAVAVRMDEIRRNGMVVDDNDMTREQINERKRQFKEDPNYQQLYAAIKTSDVDDDELAKQTLRMETGLVGGGAFSGGAFSADSGFGMMNATDLSDIATFEEAMGAMEGLASFENMALDTTIDNFFPKCTRKEGNSPTLAQVEKFANEVLPRTFFNPTSKPEAVLGGFLIRGSSKVEDGDALIKVIDKELERVSLADKMTVVYTTDFTIFANREAPPDFDVENSQILYVMGNDILPERRKVALTGSSMIGIFTCWYLSIYPFLLNQVIGKRVEDELALADAGMTVDLAWLTDLSIPLFVTFVGLQSFHEIGHRVAAAANKVEISIPTFVPSIVSGVTSSVTTFKSVPKNREAMFDVAMAGPLVGLLASTAAVVVGAQLTLASDPANLPALPLDILRQSSLGGGIIDAVLGNGILTVSEGALGTQAVAGMTIPLHPVAVAGFISLLVNALALLPVGTTDGGRIAQSMFGRAGKLGTGLVCMVVLLISGVLGSDLFLFYFAFVAAFQTGNEIPVKNEVGKVGFSRILVATAAYVLALLALIPYQ